MPQSLNNKKIFITKVIEVLASEEKLNAKEHSHLFIELDEMIGSKQYHSGLLIEKNSKKIPDFSTLNKPQIRTDLLTTLRAMLEVTVYSTQIHQISHRRISGKKVTFKVNNSLVYKHLKKDLTSAEFATLFKVCRNRGVFDLAFKHHIPAVTLSAGSSHMTRKWPRDHAGMSKLIATRYPEELWPGLHALADAYCAQDEIAAFERVMTNPEAFKDNLGITHIFWLKENGKLIRDKLWNMNQRIESHAELLSTFAEQMLLQLQEPQINIEIFTPNLIKATVYFTHYLYALKICPPSCGPWEEIPFALGINWDCASIILAFGKVQELLAQLQFHNKILNQFLQYEKHLVKKLATPTLVENPASLKDYQKASLEYIRKHHLDEFRGLCKRVDSCSTMLAASDIDLSKDNDLTANIQKRLEILENFEQNLIGEYGARRYSDFQITINEQHINSCDSYLNLNSDILLDNRYGEFYIDKKERITQLDAQSDASEVECFIERQKGFCEDTSAQWGLPLSYAALAYGKMVKRLLDKHQNTRPLSEVELELLKTCLNGEQEFIKRTYGNITGIKIDGSLPIKANGQVAEIWKKPEAYQAISTLRNDKGFDFLPGVNSHLGWDASICYQASELFLNNLEYIEKYHILED